MGAFSMALHQGEFSGPSYDTLAEGTVRSAISFVAQTFQENDHPNPTKDEGSELGRLLSRPFQALKKGDPNPVQQKALPIGVLREVAQTSSHRDSKSNIPAPYWSFLP